LVWMESLNQLWFHGMEWRLLSSIAFESFWWLTRFDFFVFDTADSGHHFNRWFSLCRHRRNPLSHEGCPPRELAGFTILQWEMLISCLQNLDTVDADKQSRKQGTENRTLLYATEWWVLRSVTSARTIFSTESSSEKSRVSISPNF
jgi:hypothetical protein